VTVRRSAWRGDLTAGRLPWWKGTGFRETSRLNLEELKYRQMAETKKFTMAGVHLARVETTRPGDDFHGWLVDQAAVLHARRSDLVDWDALAEELEAMAARERREVRKHLRNLLAHLLKWSFQSDQLPRRANSWRGTIREAREELNDLLSDSPGLTTRLEESFAETYERARNKASDDTRLPLNRFPAESPWTFDQVMSEDFWPDPAGGSLP